LFTNVSSGIAGIFYEPYKGVVMHGSKELSIGIAISTTMKQGWCVFSAVDSPRNP